ncbi:hypothetical protein J6590_004362 [Homalodisca vitripennis]|nr:hypothetical protein J6590_004362 [Homalodisca vitripennis]
MIQPEASARRRCGSQLAPLTCNLLRICDWFYMTLTDRCSCGLHVDLALHHQHSASTVWKTVSDQQALIEFLRILKVLKSKKGRLFGVVVAQCHDKPQYESKKYAPSWIGWRENENPRRMRVAPIGCSTLDLWIGDNIHVSDTFLKRGWFNFYRYPVRSLGPLTCARKDLNRTKRKSVQSKRPHTPASLAREPGSTRLEMDQIRQCMDNKEPSRVKFRRAEPDPPLLAVWLGSSISSPVYGALGSDSCPTTEKYVHSVFTTVRQTLRTTRSAKGKVFCLF